MRFPLTKWATVTLLVLVLIGLGSLGFILWQRSQIPVAVPLADNHTPIIKTIGRSVNNWPIDVYTFGTGSTTLLFVGGIHGGYEWNSVLLAYQFIDYLSATSTAWPANLTIEVIPSLNPDGLHKIIGKAGRFVATDIPAGTSTAPGRFNGNNIDLNRNFDCRWVATSTWQNKKVSAGTAPFSEPEALALKNYVTADKPTTVIFWHSMSGTVYASECGQGILPETLNLMNLYASAAGYKTSQTFDSYTVTGDAEGWLASIGIPAITVELKTHETVEWDQNLAGLKTLFGYYGAK